MIIDIFKFYLKYNILPEICQVVRLVRFQKAKAVGEY